jgi:hypothetical protein
MVGEIVWLNLTTAAQEGLAKIFPTVVYVSPLHSGGK